MKKIIFSKIDALVILAALTFLMLAIHLLGIQAGSHQAFTELYFTQHEGLPGEMSVNRSYVFNYTIRNMENVNRTYFTGVSIEYAGKTKRLLYRSVDLAPGELETIPVNLTICEHYGEAKVSAVIYNTGHEIHFRSYEEGWNQ